MEAPKLIDVADVSDVPQLVREVAQTGVPVMLGQNGEELAILMPASSPKRNSRRSRTRAARSGSLRNIIGIGESAEPTDISKHKHEYLAQAYESLHR